MTCDQGVCSLVQMRKGQAMRKCASPAVWMMLSSFFAIGIPALGSELETYIAYTGEADEDLEDHAMMMQKGPTLAPWKQHDDAWWGCHDKPPEKTGFEVFTDEGKLGPASCADLADKCHNWVNSSMVQKACAVSCFICDPAARQANEGPPCYDAAMTGVRFTNGPMASCVDLANYCNHTTLYQHIQAACRVTCGLCEAHQGMVKGECHDLDARDEPEFNVEGAIAPCSDLVDYCSGGPDAYLIRHKCPRSCGACPEMTTSTHPEFTSTEDVAFTPDNQETGEACSRRRRWGFCATRRRRNL